MSTPTCPRRSEQVLLRDAAAHHAQEHEGRNKLVADIAEIDARKAYRRAGYDSALGYCMGEFDLTKRAALHRIHVARTAWRYPVVLSALAEGRLHVAAVRVMAAKLTTTNAEELVSALSGKTLSETRRLVAERFPKPEASPLLLEVLPSTAASSQTTGLTGRSATASELERSSKSVEAPVASSEYERPSRGVEPPPPRTIVPPLSARFPTDRPRKPESRNASAGRHIPAEVKRAVAERDGRCCTFISESGKRCESRWCLEYDHVLEFARGGRSTAENLRLRCRAHNQFTGGDVRIRLHGARAIERRGVTTSGG
jgi:hypothetical protein